MSSDIRMPYSNDITIIWIQEMGIIWGSATEFTFSMFMLSNSGDGGTTEGNIAVFTCWRELIPMIWQWLVDWWNSYSVGAFPLYLVIFPQMADSMEVMVVSIIGPVLVCEWLLSATVEALISTVSSHTLCQRSMSISWPGLIWSKSYFWACLLLGYASRLCFLVWWWEPRSWVILVMPMEEKP